MVTRARYCRSESPGIVELKFYGDDVTSWTDEDTGETYVELSLKETEKLAHQLENVVYPLDDVRDEEAEEHLTHKEKDDEEENEVDSREIHEALKILVEDLKDEVDRVYDLVLELQEL